MPDLLPFTGQLPYFPLRRDDAGYEAPPAPQPLPGGAAAGDPRPATVLFCWELGGGLGHLLQMLPLANDLAARGHRVFVALRELDRAAGVFARAGVSFLQAPIWSSGATQFARPATYSEVLANVGFGSDTALFARACAWRNLMMMAKPRLIVFDHAPTALLASRAMPFPLKRALIGSGFCSPPDNGGGGDAASDFNDNREQPPWAIVRPLAAADRDPAFHREQEEQVLGRINRLLDRWQRPRLDRLGQLYAEVDENFLTTFPELDHFPGRRDAGYWGPVLSEVPGGEAPQWPGPPGRRVFVYLRDRTAIGAVLPALGRITPPAAVVAYADAVPPELRRHFESPSMRLPTRPVDLRRAAAECDAAVLGGGHGATAELLLAGKPILEVPAAQEQQLIADAVERLSAGRTISVKGADTFPLLLNGLLTDGGCAAAARAFAARYAAFNPRCQREAMLDRAQRLLASNPCPAALHTVPFCDEPAGSVGEW